MLIERMMKMTNTLLIRYYTIGITSLDLLQLQSVFYETRPHQTKIRRAKQGFHSVWRSPCALERISVVTLRRMPENESTFW